MPKFNAYVSHINFKDENRLVFNLPERAFNNSSCTFFGINYHNSFAALFHRTVAIECDNSKTYLVNRKSLQNYLTKIEVDLEVEKKPQIKETAHDKITFKKQKSVEIKQKIKSMNTKNLISELSRVCYLAQEKLEKERQEQYEAWLKQKEICNQQEAAARKAKFEQAAKGEQAALFAKMDESHKQKLIKTNLKEEAIAPSATPSQPQAEITPKKHHRARKHHTAPKPKTEAKSDDGQGVGLSSGFGDGGKPTPLLLEADAINLASVPQDAGRQDDSAFSGLFPYQAYLNLPDNTADQGRIKHTMQVW